MRHATKETIIKAIKLLEGEAWLALAERIIESKKITQSQVDNRIEYLYIVYSEFPKSKQRKLDILRRWLANGAKVKEYEVCGDYGYGPEMLTTEATKKEAIEQRKCYDKNEPDVCHSIRPVYNSLIY